ncbi:hypothetical protein Bealeia1_00782 [Candidatus Bealeia paramacronuclearis]|uniref:Uncharacterized protein n=2 Tax=Candidatus Bealeia paramacronuclearis TaxID=1921001 RepID=A0ABZ2C3F6_9PROT|nr:hypothetical protein [Candidatus Bealeia paramacronuclearis]
MYQSGIQQHYPEFISGSFSKMLRQAQHILYGKNHCESSKCRIFNGLKSFTYIAFALLLESSILEGKGGLRSIFDGEDGLENKVKNATIYLDFKMNVAHELDNNKDDDKKFEWDLYCFKKFVKHLIIRGATLEEESKTSSTYRKFRASAFFLTRNVAQKCGQENKVILESLQLNISSLGSLLSKQTELQLTEPLIEDWIKKHRHQEVIPAQSVLQIRTKSVITRAWDQWVKIPEEKK